MRHLNKTEKFFDVVQVDLELLPRLGYLLFEIEYLLKKLPLLGGKTGVGVVKEFAGNVKEVPDDWGPRGSGEARSKNEYVTI